MADGGTVWIWSTAILAASVGFAAGFLVAYIAVLRDGNSSKLRQELDQQKAEFDTYRGRVDQHFVRTSELFQDMTRQYGELYEHLAGGAQSLCSDRLVTHRPSVPESTPMVEQKADAPIGAPAAATNAPMEAKAEPAPGSQAESEEAKADALLEPASEYHTRPQPLDESELESFAPRPETERLAQAQEPASNPPATSDGTSPEPNPRVH